MSGLSAYAVASMTLKQAAAAHVAGKVDPITSNPRATTRAEQLRLMISTSINASPATRTAAKTIAKDNKWMQSPPPLTGDGGRDLSHRNLLIVLQGLSAP